MDAYLIHWPLPAPDYEDWKVIDFDTWQALEKLYGEGVVNAIGVSNFLPHHIENILESCEIAPAINQIEFHPGYSQLATVEYCQKHNILVQAWSPLGRTRVLDDPLICELAENIKAARSNLPSLCISNGCYAASEIFGNITNERKYGCF